MKIKTRHVLAFGLAMSLHLWGNPGQAQTVSAVSPDRVRAYLNLLEDAHMPLVEGLPVKCGLGVITYAMSHREALTAPLRSDAGLLLSRPDLQKSVVIGNFRIHYDTLGTNEPAFLDLSYQRIAGTANAYADSVGEILSSVASFELGSLGYPAPPSDGTVGGGAEYDVYILELGNMYGYTTPETQLNSKPDGATYTTFMTIDNDFSFVSPDSNKGLPALKVTLAHEFHHAIQIGNYGYWLNDVYYYEMTSTWMEDVVFPMVNDYLQYLRPAQAQFRNPEIPFTESNGTVEYSRAVWCHFVAKRFDRDAIRRSWELIRDLRPLPAINQSLQSAPYGSSFRSAFVEWTLWNFYTGSRSDPVQYYPEGTRYPLVTLIPFGFTPPSRDAGGSVGPLASRYFQIMSDRDTLVLALANINLDAALSGSTSPFIFTYHLNVNQVDETYHSTAAGIFYKLDVADQLNWYTWSIVRGTPGPSTVITGGPFPNPFVSDGNTSVFIPSASTTQIRGTLSIFSASMSLVYATTATSSLQLGRQVFSWNGVTSTGDVAQTGVYFYVVDLGDRFIKGKFALIRK